FLGVRLEHTGLGLFLTSEPHHPAPLYGAFKRQAVNGFGALVRLMWAALHQHCGPEKYPLGLLSGRVPKRFCFDLAEERVRDRAAVLGGLLQTFLEGRSDELIAVLERHCESHGSAGLFYENFWRDDLETLSEFYRFGPERNFRLRQELGLDQT